MPTQTAREFVIASQSTWSEKLASGNGESIPANVVTQFYRVRFGGESLSVVELTELDSQLSQLEQHWRDRNGRH